MCTYDINHKSLYIIYRDRMNEFTNLSSLYIRTQQVCLNRPHLDILNGRRKWHNYTYIYTYYSTIKRFSRVFVRENIPLCSLKTYYEWKKKSNLYYYGIRQLTHRHWMNTTHVWENTYPLMEDGSRPILKAFRIGNFSDISRKMKI